MMRKRIIHPNNITEVGRLLKGNTFEELTVLLEEGEKLFSVAHFKPDAVVHVKEIRHDHIRRTVQRGEGKVRVIHVDSQYIIDNDQRLLTHPRCPYSRIEYYAAKPRPY